MPHRPPAEIGAPLSEVDTPALIVDLDAFERNLAALPRKIGDRPVKLRARWLIPSTRSEPRPICPRCGGFLARAS